MDTSWIGFGVAGGFFAFFIARTKLGKVAPAKAHELVREGAKLIDVRTPGEFSSGHIKGAENLPLAELGRHVERLRGENKKVVVYCQSGMRSASAASMLRRGGLEVWDLGAMARWGATT